MIRIYVIRHGTTEPNTRFACVGRSDVPLNETGISQARELAKKLDAKADTIYSSPLCRAIQTIEPYIENSSGAKLSVVPELTERDFGIWENYSFKEIEQLDPKEFKIWQDNYIDYKIPGGESLTEVHDRVLPFIDELCRTHDNQTVFIMTHLCTARQIIAALLGLDAYKSRCFTLKNASYAVIDYNPELGFGVLKYLNI